MKRGAISSVQITHPTHPLRGQTFAVVPQFGGKPDPTQLLIALPNGGQQLIPIEWTDQFPRIPYPPGARFLLERLLTARQRVDLLMAKKANQAILMNTESTFDRSGGSHANQ
jgi:hypothetical protein